MKLFFKKSENKSELFVLRGASPESFDYIKMMKYLIAGDNLEDSQFEGDYSSEEIIKVNEMVEKIRETITTGKECSEQECNLPDELFSESVAPASDDEEISIEDIPF